MDSNPKRRRLRFSLRTLLVLVTIACVGFGWLGMKVRAKQRERAAVNAIRELGGRAEYDFEITYGRWNEHQDPPRGPAWLRKLLGDDAFAKVLAVVLSGRQITDFETTHLEQLPDLKFVWFNNTQITD